MKERMMRAWLYHLVTLMLAAVALLMIWSTQAAWGRLEIGTDRYRFGLLGVAHVSNAATIGERMWKSRSCSRRLRICGAASK